jgi:hypothetical protein
MWPYTAAEQAVTRAAEKFGLVTAAGAPVLRWVQDPQQAVKAPAQRAVLESAFAIALYGVLLLAWSWFQLRPRGDTGVR